ncbi:MULTISPECIES: hypothetical protein [Streptomyces]|uniref:Lipoprotein n=1 Tax=Streptomyces griseiscabiei TaxID=2993540 RepID=A0ABU4LD74_9ACTN|nr:MULTISPECIES: hypothetical protein [Streptomyces]MBZ3907501.1 hypothetical protein [Streptomyces griseiscabiei]MDX2913593.1 hypothetical protein [Streptomyces griseiscabiei]
MSRASAAAWVSAVIVALTAAGCTADAGSEHGSAADRERGSRSETLPGRELTDAERLLIQRAEGLLVKKCMEAAGFAYWVERQPSPDELKGGGYVLTDADWAKRHGYGSRITAKLLAAQRDDPNHDYADALPDKERVRYGRTLEGGPSAGMVTARLPGGGGTVQTPRASCQVDAKSELYGDFERWFRAEKTATNLTSLYVPKLLKDERFVDAVAQWSACMREAGHDYADPPAVQERLPRLTEGLSADRAYATEVRLAVAEATCATGTPLAGTARALDTEYRERELGTYGEDVAAYRRMSLTALDRAEDITGSTT